MSTYDIRLDVEGDVEIEEGETDVEAISEIVGSAMDLAGIDVSGIAVSRHGGDDDV